MSSSSNQNGPDARQGERRSSRVSAVSSATGVRRRRRRRAGAGRRERLVRQRRQLDPRPLDRLDLGLARARASAAASRVYSGGTSRTVRSLTTGGGTTLTATSRTEVASSPAATENVNDRSTASIRPRKIAPLDGAERLGRRSRRRRTGRPPWPRTGTRSPLRHRDGQRERLAPRDLARASPCRAGSGASACGQRSAPNGQEQPPQRRSCDRPGRRPRPPSSTASDPAARPKRAVRRPPLDRLAEVDRSGLLERLPDRRLAHRARAEPVVVVGRDREELDRARQPVVQARPALLDPQGDVEVGEPDDQRARPRAGRPASRRGRPGRPGTRAGRRRRGG